ncbi:XRE family transcriptional regulator [Sinomonas sp. ASV322]|uniref:helix-turn-helix domain-containing protein n=1 Tax=Sinomonas sp. ASV322 TaxID=3041920 RepID=UPI0027DC145C|nr:XRE family transcriptional regulator [Sinomonas sp. ASV322]MDQ4503439.1 XRE family transcriptional regulator [Sinomonas sp. ASV322]
MNVKSPANPARSGGSEALGEPAPSGVVPEVLGEPAPSAGAPSLHVEPAPSRVVDEQAERIGSRIRQMRRSRGLTLVQLAERTGLSHPFLSQLERGHTRPSMVSLDRIAAALGTTQVQLLAAGDPAQGGVTDGAPDVLRAGEGARSEFPNGEVRLLARGQLAFDPIEWRGANTDLGDYFRHPEDEFIYVISGSILLDLDREGTVRLDPGDSVYYRGGTSHRWCSPDGSPYHLVVVKQKPEATSLEDE